MVPRVPLVHGHTGVVAHRPVDVGCLSVGHVSKHIIRAGFEVDLVEQDKLGVHVIANVPDTEQEFDVDFAVFVAGHIDGVEKTEFVLERYRSVRHVEEGFLRLGVDRGNQRERHVHGVGDVELQRDVGDVIVHEG